jgi:CRP-like cAMP-binding protein
MQSNHLLTNLSRKDDRRLLAACDDVELYEGDVLWEPLKRIRYVYFPLDCSISELLPVYSRGFLELAVIGNEGMLGVPLLLGMNTSIWQALVQGSGAALRMSAASFHRQLDQLPALRHQLNRYAYVLQEQLAQSVACISHHTLDLRLARLLLMTHDRVVGSGGFHVTHQALAQTLGVRRVSVTNAAGLLQKRNLLSYSRGDIKILNRAGLEKASCRCYQASKDMYQRALG